MTRKLKLRVVRLILGGGVGLLGAGCSPEPPSSLGPSVTATVSLQSPPSPSSSGHQSLSSPSTPPTRLDVLIARPVCDRDSDCATQAIGNKACGGPERFVAWSRKTAKAADVEAAALAESRRLEAMAAKEGILSNCAIVIDPGAQCSAGLCRLREQPGMGSGGSR